VGAAATGFRSNAFGEFSAGSGTESTALGSSAVASGSFATALGNNAQATAANSVAVGAGSVASQANTVSFGRPGAERRLTNVAPGILPTDAPNMAQMAQLNADIRNDMKDIKRGANQGVAAATAMLTAIRTPDPGKTTISLGGGYYGGQAATALAMAHRNRSGRFQATASVGVPVSIVSGANIAAAAAISWQF
jgi:autotransporter adhesin